MADAAATVDAGVAADVADVKQAHSDRQPGSMAHDQAAAMPWRRRTADVSCQLSADCPSGRFREQRKGVNNVATDPDLRISAYTFHEI